MIDLSVEFLDWDSRFFGMRIGRLTNPPDSLAALQVAMAVARRDCIDCIYALVPADALESAWILQSSGFIARDVRLEFVRPVGSEPDSTEARDWNEADLPALENIAETAFAATRFATDPGFPRDAVRNLYRTWIANSCKGFAQAVLVEGPVGGPRGFVTLNRDKVASVARIGLIGIARDYRSQGVGSRLVAAALGWAASRGCREMQVATQASNVGAQRLYQRTGFITVSASAWYHCWPLRDLQSGTTS